MAGIAHCSCLALLETVAKSPTASWQKAKACSAPRRGQLLMRTLMQLHQGGRGPGEPGAGARLQLQLVSLALLNPSQQVHSTWVEGLETGGGRPSQQCSQWNALPGERGSSVQMRPGCPPDCMPQGLAGRGWDTGCRPGVLPACPLRLGLPPHPARICLDLQEHTGGARHYLTAGLQLLALGKEEQARAPFASFSCPCRFWKPAAGCQKVT